MSTLAHSSALALATQRHGAETSDGTNPNKAGVRYVAAVQRVEVMSLGLTAVWR